MEKNLIVDIFEKSPAALIDENGVLVIPNEVTKIKENALEGVKELSRLIMHDGITEISDNFAKDCENLIEVKLSKNLQIINTGAFSGCKKLRRLDFPNSVNEICSFVAYGAENLKTITGPSTLISTMLNIVKQSNKPIQLEINYFDNHKKTTKSLPLREYFFKFKECCDYASVSGEIEIFDDSIMIEQTLFDIFKTSYEYYYENKRIASVFDLRSEKTDYYALKTQKMEEIWNLKKHMVTKYVEAIKSRQSKLPQNSDEVIR